MKEHLKLCLLVFVFFLFGYAGIASAEERILDYSVAVKVEKDSSFVVTERITVNIEQKNINHGIYRMYPIKIREGETGLRHYDFDLLSVKLDNAPVPFHRDDMGYTTGIAIGDADKKAPLGQHTYELVYKTAQHVRFLPEHDEMYYNVTGNFWQFPIDRVLFTVELPGGSEPIKMKAYTGKIGETGTDYQILDSSSLKTTRPLLPEEGITVSVAWKKGLVAQPEETLANILAANRTSLLVGIPLFQLFVLVLSAFLYTYRGNNVVIPLFSAPKGMSPGEVYCYKHRGFSSLFLQTDILWAAVNGYLRLSLDDKNTVILTKTDPSLKKRSRRLPEWVVNFMDTFISIFEESESSTIDLSKDEGKDGASALVPRYLELKKEYETKLDKTWLTSYFPAILSSILSLGLLYFVMDDGIYFPGYELSAVVMLAILGGAVGLILLFVLAIKNAGEVASGFKRIFGVTCCALLIVGIIAALVCYAPEDYIFYASVCFSFLLAGLSFMKRYERLTDKGKKIETQIRGLEMYIRTAEKERLAKINAPEDTVEKYEEILPYAVALNCADAWQKRFNPLLQQLDYMPNWIEDEAFAGHDFDFVRYTTVIETVSASSAITQAIDSATEAYYAASREYSSSTSGYSSSYDSSDYSSFSGGSSGGGSGGGGGGGWYMHTK